MIRRERERIRKKEIAEMVKKESSIIRKSVICWVNRDSFNPFFVLLSLPDGFFFRFHTFILCSDFHSIPIPTLLKYFLKFSSFLHLKKQKCCFWKVLLLETYRWREGRKIFPQHISWRVLRTVLTEPSKKFFRFIITKNFLPEPEFGFKSFEYSSSFPFLHPSHTDQLCN